VLQDILKLHNGKTVLLYVLLVAKHVSQGVCAIAVNVDIRGLFATPVE